MKTTTILRRELGAYFNSPVAYIVVSVFLLLSGVLFFNTLFVSKNTELRELFSSFWPTLLVAIIGPAISMRLLAEEKSSDTLEVLLTMPVTDWGVILGKYFAALLLFGFAMLMMAVFGVIVAFLGPLEKGPAFSGFLGLFLTAAMYIAVGLMTSSFTKNQVVAFIVGLMICLFFWMMGKITQILPASFMAVVDWIGIDRHIDNMAKGVIDTRDLLYFGTLITGCLFVAKTSLESRRWK